MRVGSLILAGGRSQRMGQPKEFLPFGGDTLLGRTAAMLRTCTAPLVVVARDAGQSLPALPADVLRATDEHQGAGPLAGLVTGLRLLRSQGLLGPTDAVFATGCDMPFLTGEHVRWLCARLGEASVAMPRTDGVLQPLCAIYRLDALDAAEALLGEGVLTPRALCQRLPARIVEEAELRGFDPELRGLRNVNTPDDYQRALGELAAMGLRP